MPADKVFINLGQQMVHLLPFIIVLWNSKTKAKPSGLPDSNFIFFVATKPTGSILESEAKESLALRWACLARHGGNLNSGKSIRLIYFISLAGPEALENLSFCVELQRLSCFQAFPL